MKTSELIGPALNWAVAKCEGLNPNTDPAERKKYVGYSGFAEANGFGYAIKNYSTDWSQGGPIIERESIDLMKVGITQWRADCGPAVTGPTPLIAAMRAFVTKKFGAEIEIPEELS